MDIISVLELKIIQWCLICKILVRILRFSQILCCVKRKRKFSVNQSSQIVVSLFSHGRLHRELDKSVNFGNIDHHSPLCGLCGHSKWAHCEDTQETKSPLFVQSSNLLPALRGACKVFPVKQFHINIGIILCIVCDFCDLLRGIIILFLISFSCLVQVPIFIPGSL